MKVVVTGGGGYVGYHIGWAVSQGGHEVILVDLNPPDPEWKTTAPKVLFDALPEGFWGKDEISTVDLQYIKANITCFDGLKEIFQGASAVIHTASYGISGREQLNAYMTQQEEVNVMGTKTVISAAVEAKVQALVYTSTYNVVFGGKEIRDGDERLPTYPLHCHSDHYSRTKAIAEMLVLMANGKSLDLEASQSGVTALSPGTFISCRPMTLHTCVLRLAGVMGLGERRHSTRVIDALQSGFLCTFGRAENLVDFVGIQNVVQAHVKSMMVLLKEQHGFLGDHNTAAANETQRLANPANGLSGDSSTTKLTTEQDVDSGQEPNQASRHSQKSNQAAGNAYFIADGSPINHFEYFRPWYEGLGYGFPNICLPLFLIMIVAHIQQVSYLLIHEIFPFQPYITPAEVYKSGVTHYFSIKKAETYLGYKPTRPNDQTQIVEYYVSKGCTKDNDKSSMANTYIMTGIIVLVVYLLYHIMN